MRRPDTRLRAANRIGGATEPEWPRAIGPASLPIDKPCSWCVPTARGLWPSFPGRKIKPRVPAAVQESLSSGWELFDQVEDELPGPIRGRAGVCRVTHGELKLGNQGQDSARMELEPEFRHAADALGKF